MQIERKIAPYWRGLGDFEEHWAEHQIIAAARGLEIPPADEVPEGLVPQPAAGRVESPNESIQNLMVPIGSRTMSASSERSGSNPGSSLPSPTSPAPTYSLKPHKRAMAAVMSMSSRNGSQQDIVPTGPREINMNPDDPFINGQPREVFLYKEGLECPLCYMYYPRFLNTTRCCGQPICSECFVHIKRPDPHLPEHHGDQPSQEGAEANNNEDTEELIMEPSKCPYCQQPDFGITYEAPPFRRGLVYAAPGLGAMGTAMSSTSSLNTGNLSPTSANTPATANRRRTHSLSANASGVITTDRIRPDWSNKLNAARAQQRRRAAAANALHQAAFFMPGGEQRNSIFGRSTTRFISRRSTRGSENSQAASSSQQQEGEGAAAAQPLHGMVDPAGARTSSARTGPSREAINAAHLESMMMAEAIRLSLADEEERRKKEEKEAEKQAKKDAKKKEKEDRKANRRKSSISGLTGGIGSLAAASASSLSLGLGLRRRNSASAGAPSSSSAGGLMAAAGANTAASQSTEVLPTTTTSTSSSTSTSTAAAEAAAAQQQPQEASSRDKGKGVEHAAATTSESTSSQPTSAGPTSSNSSLPIPISQPPRGASHLRQISNASSISSSGMGESPSGSYPTSAQHGHGTQEDDPRGSGLSLADGGKSDDESAGATESMFNFTSLSQMVGVELEHKQGGEEATAAEHHEAQAHDAATTGSNESDKASVGHLEHVEHVETAASVATTGNMTQEKPRADSEEASSSASTPPSAQPTSVPSAGGALDSIREKNSAATATELATTLNISTTEDEEAVVNSNAPRAEPPSVMITPETPAPMSDEGQESKQLGYSN